jgi:hypothetical protein
MSTSIGECGQEYHYLIDVDFGMNGGKILFTVFDGPMTAFGGGGEKCKNQIFQGSVTEFGEFLIEQEIKENNND